MEYINDEGNGQIVLNIIEAIHNNAAYLSEIDGATGDGDHGINMDKGFLLAKERINNTMALSQALRILGRTLIMDIGGSMGPIYGTMFSTMSKSLKSQEIISKEKLYQALYQSLLSLKDLGGAKEGDKTLLDTLSPAIAQYKHAMELDEYFIECLQALRKGAKDGMEHTRDLVAKVGRAARLGERSMGFLDAGATSCFIILDELSKSMEKVIVA